MDLKKIIFTLVAILATNVLFENICAGYFKNNYICKILIEIILIFLVFICLKFNELTQRIKLSFHLFDIVSVFLILASYLFVENLLEKQIENRSLVSNLIFLIYCIFVGFFEELCFRFYIYFSLKKLYKERKTINLIFITSILFGGAHITNIFDPNYYVLSILNQVIFAFSIGFLLQSIYIRTKSFSLIVCVHALINYFGTFNTVLLNKEIGNEGYSINDFFSTFIFIMLFSILFVYPLSLYLIRNENKNINKT